MKTFKLVVLQTYQFNQHLTIEAETFEEAREKALEAFLCDWEQALHLCEETKLDRYPSKRR